MRQEPISILITVALAALCGLSAPLFAYETVTILPLGDSITRGDIGSANDYGYRQPLYQKLVNNGYDFDFTGSQKDGDFPDPNHEGHDGKTASWLNDRLNGPTDYWLEKYKPDVILCHIGTNDLTNPTCDIPDTAQDANETLEIIYYDFDPNATVILTKIILTKDDPVADARIIQYNLLLEDIAQVWSDDGFSIITVDMENALNYSTDMYDWLHPNDAGYAKMADVWFNALDAYLDNRIAPAITSSPATNATAGYLYTYDVDAAGYPDPNYILTVYPDGMAIDPNSGIIQWTPAQEGYYDVTVQASNGKSPNTEQSFTVTVIAGIEFV